MILISRELHSGTGCFGEGNSTFISGDRILIAFVVVLVSSAQGRRLPPQALLGLGTDVYVLMLLGLRLGISGPRRLIEMLNEFVRKSRLSSSSKSRVDSSSKAG